MLVAPAAALAAPPPSCSPDRLWARPGVERGYYVFCEHATAVTLSRPPAHGRLTGFTWLGDDARWRYRPDPGAPAADSLELTATGPGGTVVDTVEVTVVPLAQNTAPSCLPLADARRSDGMTPVEFVFYTQCSDAEHDALTLHGGGPGVHLDDPSQLPGGMPWYSMPTWRYRTAALDGAEVSVYWAVDEFGARSPDVPISLAFGPGVDRPVECRPRPGGSVEVLTRPGVARNFGIGCEDPDNDAYTVRLGAPPQHGTFTTFTPDLSPPPFGFGRLALIDATYVPESATMTPDPFSVIADAAAGAHEFPLRIVPTLGPVYGGLHCSYGTGSTPHDTPVDLVVECNDPVGDPLEAAVVRAPDHGTASPPMIVPARFGGQQAVVHYTPAAGFAGTDYVGVSINGGHEMLFKVWVGQPMPPFPPPPVGPGRPAPGQAPPVAHAELARKALAARAVWLVRKAGGARVYAAKRGASAVAGRPALAITCDLRCAAQARLKGRRDGRQRFTVTPGGVGVVKMPRRAVRRRATGVAFALRIRAGTATMLRGDVRLRVRR